MSLELHETGGGNNKGKRKGGGGSDDEDEGGRLQAIILFIVISFPIIPLPFIVGTITFDEQIPQAERDAYNQYCDEITRYCTDGIAGLHGSVMLGWRYIGVSIYNALSQEKWDIETYTWRNLVAEDN